MSYQWPDLHFGPINLWTAPWLGRKYEEYNRQTSNPVKPVNQVNTAHSEHIKFITKHR